MPEGVSKDTRAAQPSRKGGLEPSGNFIERGGRPTIGEGIGKARQEFFMDVKGLERREEEIQFSPKPSVGPRRVEGECQRVVCFAEPEEPGA